MNLYFGGKATIADKVWQAFGKVKSYVEPFFGSGAVLLNRPQPFAGIETVNDADGLICNFWRAVKADPDKVAEFADQPVYENNLHAFHIWLVGKKETMQAKLEADADWFDAKAAGWWAAGMAMWIGSGFCSGNGPWQVVEQEDGSRQRVHLSNAGMGVNRQLVHLGAGRGVNRKRVHLSNAGQGVNRKRVSEGGYGKAGCGEQGLLAWMQALAKRLERVRVCCGDWARICGGKSGNSLNHFFAGGEPCGIFLDPPYADTANRHSSIYRKDDLQVAHTVRDWAVAHGDDKRLRIVLCGYDCEHEMPSRWRSVAWKANGGMSMIGRGATRGKENAYRETLWMSPHCVDDSHGLFAGMPSGEDDEESVE